MILLYLQSVVSKNRILIKLSYWFTQMNIKFNSTSALLSIYTIIESEKRTFSTRKITKTFEIETDVLYNM